MGTHQGKRVIWRVGMVDGLATMQAVDRETGAWIVVEASEDAIRIRVGDLLPNGGGLLVRIDALVDTLCDIVPVEEVPLIEERPGLARCRRPESGIIDAVVLDEPEAA